ncbi:hypothetical protein [Porphyrobacter sp. ULC335]|jgi:hypothetical protein|uniref:hypothetical protein n=1 Tax=Porphyrobacter sp. ULC335 TaxID=2854260 RepID=UPI00221F4DE6|nr:hypothetical protein [Porphyrobacter sp. ULC335]UYV17021.1 hypothetical protein KVF90_06935 [Porphyrobacter sp. ULC335]
MPRPDQSNRIDETDAKGGSNEGVVRWVLLFSLGLAIIAMTIIWVTGALTQDADESQGTATGRAEVEAEAASDDSSIDGITVDDPDAGAPPTSADR